MKLTSMLCTMDYKKLQFWNEVCWAFNFTFFYFKAELFENDEFINAFFQPIQRIQPIQ